jgi:hypothetical protein
MVLASDPTRPMPDDPPELPEWTLEAALCLVSYFKTHARRVYAAIGGKADDGGEDVRALVRWILRNDLSEFSERDIGRNFDRFQDDPAALDEALEWMTGHNLVRPRAEPMATGKPGRKPSLIFDVNPTLKTSPRFRRFRRNASP